MSGETLYAPPRTVASLDKCFFYHTTEIPEYGLVEGPWDLRKDTGEYLGGVDFNGKRALDVGTASGFLTFFMEKQGAEVVSYDLSPEHIMNGLDTAPSRYDSEKLVLEGKSYMESLNNS